MEITKSYNKLQKLAQTYSTNDVLRFDFYYNDYKITAFYSATKGGMQITFVFNIEKGSYMLPLYFYKETKFGHTTISTIPFFENIYNDIKVVFENDDYKTTPLFTYFFEDIVFNNTPTFTTTTDINRIPNHVCNGNNNKKPYYWHLRRVNMSQEMKDKIMNIYPKKIYKPILKICENTNVTLVFTNDITQSGDLFADLNLK